MAVDNATIVLRTAPRHFDLHGRGAAAGAVCGRQNQGLAGTDNEGGVGTARAVADGGGDQARAPPAHVPALRRAGRASPPPATSGRSISACFFLANFPVYLPFLLVSPFVRSFVLGHRLTGAAAATAYRRRGRGSWTRQSRTWRCCGAWWRRSNPMTLSPWQGGGLWQTAPVHLERCSR